MSEKSPISRRNWLKLGIAGAAGTVIAQACTSPAEGTTAVAAANASCAVSPRQELGPFPPMKALSQTDHDTDLTMVDGHTEMATGDVIIVQGKVMDLQCQPVAGAIVQIWQSNHHGKYHHEMDLSDYEEDPNFQGWGQAITNEAGEYRFKTIKPGLYTGRTRHIHYKVSKRGYHELVTQLYFEGEEQNETDGLLNQLTHDDQQRLITHFDDTSGTPTGTFDIYLSSVASGSVSPEVLAEYVGQYEFDLAADHPMRGWLSSIGVDASTILADVTAEDRQLYLQITSTPVAEIFWTKKDTFDGIAQYSSVITFQRQNGQVSGLTMAMNVSPTEVMEISASKVGA